MRLDEGHKKAIARVDVFEGSAQQSRGTGFLVADGLVLTAAHVIFDEQGNPRGDSIWLSFGTNATWPQGVKTVVEAKIARAPGPGRELYDVTGDWAVLACSSPAGAAPLSLGRLRDGYGEPSWSTFGYGEATSTGKEQGLPYSGTIQDESAGSFTLHVIQAAAGAGSDLSGLSGAPCMVHGRVVGMIRSAELTQGAALTSVEGRAYATAMRVIAAACPEVVRLEAIARVPYEGQLVDALGAREGMARSMAGRLEIDRAATADIADLRARIAGELFRRGLKTTVDVAIEHFEDLAAGAERLVDLAETFWVPDGAAEQLRALADKPHKTRVAALNTGDRAIADHYLRRAGTLENRSPDGWTLKVIPIDGVSGEDRLAAIEQQIRDHFDAVYAAQSDQDIRDMLRDERPCLILLQDALPQDDILDAIETKFEGIYIVVLTGQAWTPKEGRVDYVVPEIGPGEEKRVLDGCRRHRKRFEWRKAQQKKRST